MRYSVILLMALFALTPLLSMAGPVKAATLEVGPGKTYAHPQDAVNAASPGDTILVYPSIYNSRKAPNIKPPHWTDPGDFYAPPLIVYKDNLTIRAVDPDPANTIIQSTLYAAWTNPVAIQWSTGGTLVGGAYVGAGVNPDFGTAPNAIDIIASGVTIDGFTIKRPKNWTGECPPQGVDGWAFWNSFGIQIGGLYSGDDGTATDYQLGEANGNTVQNCVFEDVWQAIFIWHSSDNKILNNYVKALEPDCTPWDKWMAISVWDGGNWGVDQVSYPNPSKNNTIIGNTLENKGIEVGAGCGDLEPADCAYWNWTNLDGTFICCNNATKVGVKNAHGRVVIACNINATGPSGFFELRTDDAICISEIEYMGQTEPGGPTICAKLIYEGSGDADGFQMMFTVNSQQYFATTDADGKACVTVSGLQEGLYYDVTVELTASDPCCRFTALGNNENGKGLLLGFTRAVAGELVTLNKLELLGPYIIVAGLIGAVATAYTVKKRKVLTK